MGWFVELKLHLLCNKNGEIITFELTKANVDNGNGNVIDTLTDKLIFTD